MAGSLRTLLQFWKNRNVFEWDILLYLDCSDLYLFYQVCPEGPCGSTTTAGTPYNLPDIAAPEGPPCVGFSVGENGAGNVPALSTECGGDLIRINGKST